MNKIIISTESGSDLPRKVTVPRGIWVLPMHVALGGKTLCEGSFDAGEIFEYYKNNKELPKTSAPNPEDYTRHFNSIFKLHPDSAVLHIAYSSKLSASYQNALLASHEFDSGKLAVIDSLNASSGLGTLVMCACDIRDRLKNVFTFSEYASLVKQARQRVCCSFVPQSLEHLRAGGRITAASSLGAAALGLKPSIVIRDGCLEAGRRYRGTVMQIAFKYLDDFVKENDLRRDCIVIGYSHGLSKNILFALKRRAHKLGFAKSWCFQMSGAVSSHTGPGCIGYAGISKTNK